MEELRAKINDDIMQDIIVYTGYVYIITSGSNRKFGYADNIEKVYKQASTVGKKNSIIIHRCKDQETVCAHLGAWLIA
jgi:hypothetical protein